MIPCLRLRLARAFTSPLVRWLSAGLASNFLRVWRARHPAKAL